MNHFGRIFQLNIFGESHGDSVGVLVDGIIPGIKLSKEDFKADLLRRKSGGIGTTPRIEPDEILIESGVFNGYTTGAPILLRFLNTNTKSKDYSNLVSHPRPSHADYVGNVKFQGFNDYRGGGAFSGRLTLGLTSAGVIAKKMLEDVKFETKLINLNGETDQSKFKEILESAVEAKDSVGGIVEVKVNNLPVGLGEPYFDSVESVLSHLLFSIGGVKGVEFGIGFKGASLKGSEFNDMIIDEKGTTKTNNNGGINGGITNGNELVVRVFVKPTPSISLPQNTYNFNDKKVEELVIEGRHDSAIILRAMVVIENAIACGLCDLKLLTNSLRKND